MSDRKPLNDGTMVTFYDTDFPAMTAGEARAISTIIKIATGKVFDAKDGIPRTKRGIEAREDLLDANSFLMDLYAAMQVIERVRSTDG